MAVQSRSTLFLARFDSAFQAYQETTSVTFATHPIAVRLLDSNSVESIATILLYEARAFSNSRGFDRITKAIESIVTILSTLSSTAPVSTAIGMSFPPAKAIQAGLAILLAAANGKPSSYDGLIDLLESIERFINRLNIYTRIPSTPAIEEIVVNIMAELLSTLALATKELKQGRSIKLVSKLFGGKDVDAVLQRLDRLTQDEARTTVAQTLEVVHRLVRNMSVVMDDGKASADDIQDALEILHHVVSEMNKLKRDKLQQDIFRWLSPPDPWKNHNIARGSRHSETGAWFIHGNTLSEWKASRSRYLLWIHGKPGSGKSVLCSTIIEEIEIMRKSGLASLAMYYYDFRDDQKKDLRGLLASVLFQLCDQSDSYSDALSAFYSTHRHGTQSPSVDQLARCLKNLLNLPGQAPVYLIVDALDECPDTSSLSSPREQVLGLLEDLVDSQLPNLRICVTSRPEADIKPVLEPLTFRSVSLHDESGQREDIEKYIKSVISTHRKMRRWTLEHKQLVVDVLTSRANGMFRWAYCQLDYLGDCLPGRIRHALNELPPTLDATYERTLWEIKETNWEFAQRLLICVAVVSRPLRVEELAEFLAFDFEAGPIPAYCENWRVEDPIEAVLSTCSTLLALVDVGDSPVIQFSHFSVKEFLTSARFAQKHNTISRRFHISMTPAHTLVAQACLGLLLHLDKNITRSSLMQFPLAKFAAKYWFVHARFEHVSQNVDEGLKQLFDQRKHHFLVWLWICYPITPPWMPQAQADRPFPHSGTPLHYAALCGLQALVKVLAITNSRDVSSRNFHDDSTPLHLASREGHLEAARILIECGADAAAQTKHRTTPLHEASRGGHVELARLLIRCGANVEARNLHWETPLHVGSEKGHVGLAQLLIDSGADIEAQTPFDRLTPLHLASLGGHVDLARLLVERGADMAAQNMAGWTPLHVAAALHTKLARLLVEHGTDIAIRAKDGSTPLHIACEGGHVECAYLLVERGVDAAARTNNGSTPLHEVSRVGDVGLTRLLIEHGANVAAKTEDGWTPLHSASDEGHMELARLLIERGADVAAQTKHGWTPLHGASRIGHMKLARLLVERGADASVRSRDASGWSPLHWTARGGHVELARFLIDCGADTAAQTKDGETPLHLASQWGHVEHARLLVELGADTTAQTEDGKTPLHLASQGGHVELAQLLGEYDARETVQAMPHIQLPTLT